MGNAAIKKTVNTITYQGAEESVSANVAFKEHLALNDTQLLERICNGDQLAFAGLVRRHTDRFYRIAYRLLRNKSEAEDIVQTAFLKLWSKPLLWQSNRNTSFTTWFYRVVINLCLDFHKKKRPVALEDDTWVLDERQNSEESMLLRERQEWLERYIAELPERQRIALNLCFYEELSNQQAADIMGIHIKALQSLLMRAKLSLRSKLEEKNGY